MRGKAARLWAAAAIAAVIAAPVAAPIAPAQAQTAETCLSVENNRSRQTSVAVVGFNETSAYWTFNAGESAILVNSNGPLRGSSFTVRLYEGEGIDSSRQLEGNNKYVSWRFDAQITDNGKCTDGAWVATLHD